MTTKYVNTKKHPTKDYHLECYNKKAFFHKHWTDETINARGHVYDAEGNVLSFPFTKFFNIDENELVKRDDVIQYIFDHQASIEVFPKYNGHLAIMFFDGDEWVSHTKGSFDHEYVALDRIVIEDSGFTPEVLANIPTEWTLCFEIIADYDPHLLTKDHKREFGLIKDFAILLGANDRETKKTVSPFTVFNTIEPFMYEHTGKRLIMATSHPIDTFHSYVQVDEWLHMMKSIGGCEGFILHDVETDWRIKIKTDWFVYERYKFQFNADKTRKIFQRHFDTEKAFEAIPEEFHEGYRAIIREYGEFRKSVNESTMDLYAKMHEAGLRMHHELVDYTNANPNLTQGERDVILAFLTNSGLDDNTFTLFCDTYSKFSLVDKKE